MLNVFGINPGSVITTRNVRFKNGNNVENGGAIWIQSLSSDADAHDHQLHVAGCDFVGNTAKWDGGAIYTTGGMLIENSTFTNNVASGNAGAVRVVNAYPTRSNLFRGVVFSGNKATWSGGAVYTPGAGATVNFTDCTFTGNSAGKLGGGVASNGGDVTDVGGKYEKNTAIKGGALAMTGGVLIATRTVMTSNAATAYGGGVFYATSITPSLNFPWPVRLDRASLLKNTANDGGGVYAPSVSVSAGSSTCVYSFIRST